MMSKNGIKKCEIFLGDWHNMKNVFPHSRAQKNDLAMASDKKLTPVRNRQIFVFWVLSN